MIYENGRLLAESERFPAEEQRSVADVDLDLLRAERLRMGTFDDNRRHHQDALNAFRRIDFQLDPPAGDIGLLRQVERFPFVPSDVQRLEQDCYEGYNIQVAGLEQRLRALNYPKVVIGVSGGLDSTHALIVAAKAMDRRTGRAATSWHSPCPGSPPASAPRATRSNCLRPFWGYVRRDRHPQDGRVDAGRDRSSLRAR